MKKIKKPSKFINYENLDKIGEVALYYGFLPYKSPTISKEDIDIAKEMSETKDFLPITEEKVALLRMYTENNMYNLPQPVMLYFKDNIRGSKADKKYAELEILGSSGSIAEATLIQTARMMLYEEGYKNISVEVNSAGDRDSANRFIRELTAYYRKNINNMNADCRELLKVGPCELLTSKNPTCIALNEKAPKSLDFLNENARKHLEEIFEYLEVLGIPYTMSNDFLHGQKYCAETLFSIVDNDNIDKSGNKKVLARGMRYSGLAKKVGAKKDVTGVGISILVKSNDVSLRKPLSKAKKPFASFIQLGLESKLLSLTIIESLRQVKISLQLSLAKDRLGAQVSNVEKSHAPYIIVMGKKEAVDKTAVVRKNDTHAQITIPISELPEYLKKLEKEYN